MGIIIERHNDHDLGRAFLPGFIDDAAQPADVEGSQRCAHRPYPGCPALPAPSAARRASALWSPRGGKIEGWRSANSAFSARMLGMLRVLTIEAACTRYSQISSGTNTPSSPNSAKRHHRS